MLKFIFNNKGFIFIEVIFISLLVSFTAILIVRGLKTAVTANQTSAIKTAAMHIANAQMSEIEEYVNKNKSLPSSYNFIDESDLIYEDFLGMKEPVIFYIETEVSDSTLNGQLLRVTVKVSWQIGDNEDSNITDDDKDYEQISRDISIN